MIIPSEVEIEMKARKIQRHNPVARNLLSREASCRPSIVPSKKRKKVRDRVDTHSDSW